MEKVICLLNEIVECNIDPEKDKDLLEHYSAICLLISEIKIHIPLTLRKGAKYQIIVNRVCNQRGE